MNYDSNKGVNWLECYMLEAISANLCTRLNCTTCGSQDFKSGLLKRAADATGMATRGQRESLATEILSKLCEIRQPDRHDYAFLSAVMAVLHQSWRMLGNPGFEEAASQLHGSWANEVLESMRAHASARAKALQDHAERNDPENVRLRREEKRRLRQAQHKIRLEAQRQRSIQWHRDNSKPDSQQ